MTLELSTTKQGVKQKENPETVVFLNFLIELYDITSKAPFDKLDTTDINNFKILFPTFMKISDLCNSVSTDIKNLFYLKWSYLYHLEKKFRKVILPDKKLAKIIISFGSKQSHTTHYLLNYKREFYAKLSNVLIRNRYKLESLKPDQFFLQFNAFFISCFDVIYEDAEIKYPFYQLILQFLHYSNWLSSPILFFHVIYFHFKHIYPKKFLKDPSDLTTNVSTYQSKIESESDSNSISYIPDENDRKYFPLIPSKTKIALLDAKRRFYSTVDQSIISNNSVTPKIHQLGLRYYLIELPATPFLNEITIPDYVIEVMKFKKRTIIIGATYVSNSHYIRRKIIKIKKLSVSRSLALYLMKKTFVLNLKKKNGLFPAFNKEFCFTNTKNLLKKCLEEDKSLYEYIINNWEHGRYENTFSQFIDNNTTTEIEKIVDGNDLEHIIHQKERNKLLTNLPLHINHMKSIFIYVVYIHFIAYRKTCNSLYTNKEIRETAIDEMKDFIQIWGDRVHIWETDNHLLCTIAFPEKMPGFVIALKKKLEDLKEIWDLVYTFDYHLFDQKTFINNNIRYRNQTGHPSFKNLNPETGDWELPIPNISEIRKDFGI
jgi:hypothetical protein